VKNNTIAGIFDTDTVLVFVLRFVCITFGDR